jgi:endo-1,4-beta-xylanase
MDRLLLRARGQNGEPLPASGFDSLYLTDLERSPIRKPYGRVEAGLATIDRAEGPVVIVMKMPVEGFGTVALFADNEGKGYCAGAGAGANAGAGGGAGAGSGAGRARAGAAATGAIDLPLEFARSRLHAVRQRLAAAQREGFAASPKLAGRLERSAAALKTALKLAGDAGQAGAPGAASSDAIARAAGESLCESLWAGEELVFEIAKARIARSRAERGGPRKGFLFGCNAFGLAHGEKYTKPFEAVFNFGTVPFYRAGFESEEGKPNYDRADAITAWLRGAGLKPKGHPLTWFHQAGIAPWMKTKTFDQNLASARERCQTIARRYAGRIDCWDAINEAHDWANELGYSQEQLLELTRASCEGTRAGNPAAQVIVNNCLVFGDYVATGLTYFRQEERPLRTPHQYLRACLSAGIDFDAIGLQLYYPGYDMFEIDRLMDSYASLGKPLHVTELGVSSAAGRDERAHVKEPSSSYWHGPWSETVQADWVEQFYTICYSKPAVEAITWWDFADAGHFWPHGGFLRPDFTPKESYGRLKGLIESLRA